MPIATRTTPAAVAAPLTQTSFVAGLRNALNEAFGAPALKSYIVGSEQFVVWELVGDATRPFGRCWYRLRVTTGLIVSAAIGASWTDATNTLGNPCSEANSTTYTANQAVSFLTFATAEYKFALAIQGSAMQLLGFVRPTICPAFDEGSNPRFFIPVNSNMSGVYCTGLSPYGTAGVSTAIATLWGQANFGGPDPILQQRTIATGVWLWSPNNNGILGQTSEDLAVCPGTGMARGDTLFDLPAPDPNRREYFLFSGGSGAIGVRIA